VFTVVVLSLETDQPVKKQNKDTKHGAFGGFELMADNVETANAFYKGLFR